MVAIHGKSDVPLEVEKEGKQKRDKQLKDINGNKVEVFV